MTFFGKTKDDLIAFCKNGEYIETCPNGYYLYNESGLIHMDIKIPDEIIAAINGNRVLFPRDFSTAVAAATLDYRHCDPIPALREFKRKTLTHAYLIGSRLRFQSLDTEWSTGIDIKPEHMLIVHSFVKTFNDLDVTEESPAIVQLLAVTLQQVVRCCDLKDPWGQLLAWRAKRQGEILLLKDGWMRISQAQLQDQMVHLPCVIPPSLIDDLNRGAPVPFEKFYSADEALKLLERYYGTENFSPFIKLFKDGKLSRSAVLP
jgi:hypothetical protein